MLVWRNAVAGTYFGSGLLSAACCQQSCALPVLSIHAKGLLATDTDRPCFQAAPGSGGQCEQPRHMPLIPALSQVRVPFINLVVGTGVLSVTGISFVFLTPVQAYIRTYIVGPPGCCISMARLLAAFFCTCKAALRCSMPLADNKCLFACACRPAA